MNAITSAAPSLKRRVAAAAVTKKQILATAKMIFAEKGFEDATLREIASTAGFSTGAIFTHFDSKEELFSAVLDQDFHEDLGWIERISLEEGDVIDLLVKLFGVDYKRQAMQMCVLRSKLALWWANYEHINRHMYRVQQNMQAYASTILLKACEKDKLSGALIMGPAAEIIWDLYIGEYLRMPIDAPPALYSWEETFNSKVRMALEGYLP